MKIVFNVNFCFSHLFYVHKIEDRDYFSQLALERRRKKLSSIYAADAESNKTKRYLNENVVIYERVWNLQGRGCT